MNPFELHFNTIELLNDVPGLIMSNMAPVAENIPVFIMMAINITLGFMLYTNVSTIKKRDGKDIYPLFLHCLMLVWDVMCTIMMWVLAFQYDFFWLWTLFGVLEPIWVIGEINSIKSLIKSQEDRQEEFGQLVSGEVTQRQAIGFTSIMIVVSTAIWVSISYILGGFDNASLLVTWPWTNLVFPWVAWQYWETRAARTGTSIGNSMKVQMTIAIQCTLSWFPGTWFVLMMPFLANPAFYFIGILTTALCIVNVLKVRKLPKPAHLLNKEVPNEPAA